MFKYVLFLCGFALVSGCHAATTTMVDWNTNIKNKPNIVAGTNPGEIVISGTSSGPMLTVAQAGAGYAALFSGNVTVAASASLTASTVLMSGGTTIFAGGQTTTFSSGTVTTFAGNVTITSGAGLTVSNLLESGGATILTGGQTTTFGGGTTTTFNGIVAGTHGQPFGTGDSPTFAAVTLGGLSGGGATSACISNIGLLYRAPC